MSPTAYSVLKLKLLELETLRLVYPELTFEPVQESNLSEEALKVYKEYQKVFSELVTYEMENQHNGIIPEGKYYHAEYYFMHSIFDRVRHIVRIRFQNQMSN